MNDNLKKGIIITLIAATVFAVAACLIYVIM